MNGLADIRGLLSRADAWRRLSRVARRVKRERLTYLSLEKLANLERCAREVERRDVPGDVIEAGIALGGSAIVLASHLTPRRAFHGYDVFGMIPPPSARDSADSYERYDVIASGRSRGIDGDDYYGYTDDLYERVVAGFRAHRLEPGARVHLHQGLFEDTLHPDAPLALVHIDSDWHDPVKLCLERIYPQLSSGGLVVLDDYHDYEGCRTATDAFMAEREDIAVARDRGNLVLRRA